MENKNPQMNEEEFIETYQEEQEITTSKTNGHISSEAEINQVNESVQARENIQTESSQVNSSNEENALVREIKMFMETEEKESIKPIENTNENMINFEKELKIVHENDDSVICEFETSETKYTNEIIVNGEENIVTNHMSGNSTEIQESSTNFNGTGTGTTTVLDSIENVLSRKSDSRMSVKKRKQKNSLKGGDQLPDLIDSVEKSDLGPRPKSREVFDFYANSIDQDTAATESQVSKQNGFPDITNKTENGKSDEQIVIENLLNSIPKELPGCDRLSEKGIEENGSSIVENGAVFEKLEDTETCTVNSASTSGANTLRRRKNSSKKKRKSKHIL